MMKGQEQSPNQLAQPIGSTSVGRPIYAFPRNGTETVLDLLGFSLVLTGFSVLIWYWRDLPDRVAIHFNFRGEPDGWGSKYFLIALPVITLIIYATLGALRRIPHRFNYPFRITEANALRAYQQARLAITLLRIEIAAFLTVLTVFTVLSGLGRMSKLPAWPMFLGMAVILLTAIGMALRSYVSGRTDGAERTTR